MTPVLAISLGCPAGIGPEIVAKSLGSSGDSFVPVVFGHLPSFLSAIKNVDIDPSKVEPLDTIGSIDRQKVKKIQFVHTGGPEGPITQPSIDAALSQFRSLEMAVDGVLDGRCDGICTAPVSKEWVAKVQPGFTGHTEYLAQRDGLGKDDVTMLFATTELVVGLITTHIPMVRIPGTITRRRYERTTVHVAETASRLTGVPVPRIGVAGLNPHAGEAGLLGMEEVVVIGPFCREWDSKASQVVGPIPADAVFRDAFSGVYQGVVAAYHDQALIPLKLSGFGNAVNVTGGLSFTRTSPDHGTAYEIARKNVADASAMARAIEMATILIGGRAK